VARGSLDLSRFCGNLLFLQLFEEIMSFQKSSLSMYLVVIWSFICFNQVFEELAPNLVIMNFVISQCHSTEVGIIAHNEEIMRLL
jgi:hypothetical protein